MLVGRLRRVSEVPAPAVSRSGQRPVQDWRALLAIYAITALIESTGVSQVFAFLPLRLHQMGLLAPEVAAFTGIFTALIFVFGIFLVPFWAVGRQVQPARGDRPQRAGRDGRLRGRGAGPRTVAVGCRPSPDGPSAGQHRRHARRAARREPDPSHRHGQRVLRRDRPRRVCARTHPRRIHRGRPAPAADLGLLAGVGALGSVGGPAHDRVKGRETGDGSRRTIAGSRCFGGSQRGI